MRCWPSPTAARNTLKNKAARELTTKTAIGIQIGFCLIFCLVIKHLLSRYNSISGAFSQQATQQCKKCILALGNNKIRFQNGFGADQTCLKRGAAGHGIGEGKFSFTLKLPDLFVRQNSVDNLLKVQRAKRFIREIALGGAATAACQWRLAGAKVQLAAAGLNGFVEQFIQVNFAYG